MNSRKIYANKYIYFYLDPKLIVRDSPVRAAIPILPMPLATLCFVLNLLVPGFGKMLYIFEGNIPYAH